MWTILVKMIMLRPQMRVLIETNPTRRLGDYLGLPGLLIRMRCQMNVSCVFLSHSSTKLACPIPEKQVLAQGRQAKVLGGKGDALFSVDANHGFFYRWPIGQLEVDTSNLMMISISVASPNSWEIFEDQVPLLNFFSTR